MIKTIEREKRERERAKDDVKIIYCSYYTYTEKILY